MEGAFLGILYLSSLLIFFMTFIIIWNPIYCIFFFLANLSHSNGNYTRGRNFYVLLTGVSTELRTKLIHSLCSINIFWMNKWIAYRLHFVDAEYIPTSTHRFAPPHPYSLIIYLPFSFWNTLWLFIHFGHSLDKAFPLPGILILALQPIYVHLS